MSLILTGSIHCINGKQRINDNLNVQKWILKVDENTNYPQWVQLQCANQKCDQLNSLKTGDKVNVKVNIRGRINPNDDTQAFTTLEAWQIDKVQ